MSGPITAVARLKAAPGQEELVRAQALSLVAPTLAEPGCLFYRPYQDPLDPASWVVVEQWASRADFDAHLAAPHMAEAFAAGATLLAGPPELQLLTDLA
ncbi:antibiotic biosynthesis monooxygenase [Kitasatospora purpeofusca]|uniref:putative quinol monooxygenase n=1 Tax=Kitasatospora purpeofusca TaxID=67352 RepID=UPI0032525104